MNWTDAAKLMSEMCAGVSLGALPIFQWLPKYSLGFLRADLIAGISVGVLLIPQSMAYSLLAGLPPIYGLYSASIPLLVYALLASSTKVSPGPVAPTSILINGIIMSIASSSDDTAQLVRLATGVAFATGVIQITLGLFRFGFIAQLLSWPVMSGYLAGAAITIVVSQLRDFFGMTYPPGTADRLFFERVGNVFTHLDTITWETTVIGVACLIALVGFKYLPACGLWPRCAVRCCGDKPPKWIPLQLIVVVICLLVALAMGLTPTGYLSGSQRVAVVGPIPASLPAPALPFDSFAEFMQVLPQSFVLAVIAYVGTISLALSFARQDSEEVSGNMELFASGTACLVGSFFGSFTVAGSFTRTAVNAEVGAKTPMAVFFTGCLMLLTLLFISSIFETLPKAALAAMVVASTQSLIKPMEMVMFWRQKRVDGVQAITTFIFTLWLGIDWGIIAAVILAVALLVLRSFKPRITELGNLPSTSVFVDRARYPEAQLVPGVIVYRIDGELHFGNVKAVSTLLTKTLAAAVEAGAVPSRSGPGSAPEAPAAAADAEPAQEGAATTAADAAAEALASASAADSAERGAAGPGAMAATEAGEAEEQRDGAHASGAQWPQGAADSDDPADGDSTPLRVAAKGSEDGYKYRKPNRGSLPITAAAAAESGDDGEDARAAAQRTPAGSSPRGGSGGEEADASASSEPPAGVPRGPAVSAASLEASALARLGAERAAMLASGVLRAVVLDGIRVSAIDLTACRDLRTATREYAKHGVRLLLAAMPGPSRDVAEKFGVMMSEEEEQERAAAKKQARRPPPVKRYITVAAAVASVVRRELWPKIRASGSASHAGRVVVGEEGEVVLGAHESSASGDAVTEATLRGELVAPAEPAQDATK